MKGLKDKVTVITGAASGIGHGFPMRQDSIKIIEVSSP